MQLHVGIIVVTELILSNVNGCPSGGKGTKKGNQFSTKDMYLIILNYVIIFTFRSKH